jgi:hypothetical protein
MLNDASMCMYRLRSLQFHKLAVDELFFLSQKDDITFLESAAETCAGAEASSRGLSRYASKLLQAVGLHVSAHALCILAVFEDGRNDAGFPRRSEVSGALRSEPTSIQDSRPSYHTRKDTSIDGCLLHPKLRLLIRAAYAMATALRICFTIFLFF